AAALFVASCKAQREEIYSSISLHRRILKRLRAKLTSAQGELYERIGATISAELDALRRLDAAYLLMSLGIMDKRNEFLLFPDARPRLAEEVILDGGVFDEGGYFYALESQA